MRSPIFYMGSKSRLIDKGLILKFPKNINTFVDAFCGSGVVSMNVTANNYILNDLNPHTIELLQLFKEYDGFEIINHLESIISKFGLIQGCNVNDSSKSTSYKELACDRYSAFRNYYNTTDNSSLNLYALSFYSNSNNIRFNSDGNFNMPIGNGRFSPVTHYPLIIGGVKFFSQERVTLCQGNYSDLDFESLSETDFIYFDPPYLNTLAIYNEQDGWELQDDLKLFNLLDYLNHKGIRWGLSNVFENKGIRNSHLIEWASQYTVEFFDNFTYSSCGKGNANSTEVYICNYDIKQDSNVVTQFNIFDF